MWLECRVMDTEVDGMNSGIGHVVRMSSYGYRG